MKTPTTSLLRIIDASLNRIGEGLRVLEEYARFSLNDNTLTQQLKNLRHRIVRVSPGIEARLLLARNSSEDIGADMEVPGENKQRDVSGIISANARRAQESLRVMEEISRDVDLNLGTNDYKKARFELYTIQKDLMARVFRQEKLKKITGIYAVIDVAFLKGRNLTAVAGGIIRGGVKIIQLRDKERRVKDFLASALELRELCNKHEALFIVNDSLEIALASEADGLHIGQDDLPVSAARRLLPIDKILGVSARTPEEAKTAKAEGADYLGVGAIFPTTTKQSGAIGLDMLKQIRRSVDIPLVAIGGINQSNVKSVIKAGADASAVISAIMSAEDTEQATRELLKIYGGTHDK
jgi:thiamine-phosphate pyrophosphorylase